MLPDGLKIKLGGLTETSPPSLIVTVTAPEGSVANLTVYSAVSPSVTIKDDGVNTKLGVGGGWVLSSSWMAAVAEPDPDAIV